MARTIGAWKNGERAQRLLNAYGITEQEYDSLLDEQGGGCAICGIPPTDKAHAVDHCHKSGHIRGLLCAPCNITLGKIEKRGLSAFENYLERNGGHSATIRELYFNAFPSPPPSACEWDGDDPAW